MEIERSSATAADLKKVRRGLRRIVCSLFLFAAVAAATVGAFASPRTNHGLAGASKASPASIIVVTNTNDNGPGSLRNALAIANDGDTIDATGVSGTILLTSGGLQIYYNVTINGPGAGNLAVNGNATFRVFENFASNVTISGFTITNGFTTDAVYGGGGVLNHGGLALNGSSIVSNLGGAYGGGISSSGAEALTVTNSLISDNSAAVDGGGIAICCGEALTVTNSVISSNSGGANGGGGIDAVNLGTMVTVSNSQINNNVVNSTAAGGGIFSGDQAQLTVANSVISSNVAGGGGGILTGGSATLTVTNSVIRGNLSVHSGGGIEADSGTVTVSNSTINDNQYFCMGGGIYAVAQLTVMNSTISGNSSIGIGCNPPFLGGSGIASFGTLTVINSTISGNHADFLEDKGGGIFNGGFPSGNLTVTNSTISDNTAANHGGAIYNSGGTVNIGDTVLNAGASGGTIFNAFNEGTVTSLGYNLASDNGGGVLTGPGDQINTDPMLGPLQDNGGPTFTHALLPGSPAIDAGDPNFTPPPDFDQRGPGFPRVVNGRIDKGSFEVQVPRASPTPRPRPTPAPRP